MSRPLRTRAGLGLALLAFVSPQVARAQDAPPSEFGEELEVLAPRRHATPDPTAATTVVEADRYAGEAKTVAELVGTAPGVAVSQYGGLGQLATVSIRGSTADQVQVLLDGLPLNTAAGGGVDLSRIPRAWIDRIEIVRGAEGARYGTGALGGVVNVVTRRSAAGSWSAEASAGSFATFSGALDGAVGGAQWGLMGAAAIDATGGEFEYLFDPTPGLPGDAAQVRLRTHDAALALGALVKGWGAVGAGRLDAVLHLGGGHRDLPGSPYATTPFDSQDDARQGLVVRYAHPVGPGLDVEVQGSARHDRLDVTIAPYPESRQDDVAGRLELRLVWVAGPSTVTASVAGGGERLEVSGAGAYARGELALALADELVLAEGRLRLVPALRWERIGGFDALSARLGAAWRVAGPLSLRAGVARSARVPSFAELYLQQGLLAPNPDLVPELGWSADAAIAVDGPLGMASAGAFATLYDDLIVYEAASFRRMKPFNDARAVARGLEAELATVPLGPARLTLAGAYTLLLTETLRGPEPVLGRDLPHRPRHRLFARLGTDWEVAEGHGEVHWVSGQFLDLANLLPVPAALTFNVGASVRLLRRPELRLHLEVRNLLDDRTLQDGFGNPLPGRMVLLTLRVAGGKDTASP